MLDIPLIVAFIAGVVSFLSPCVLPIIPGFLAYLGGTNFEGEVDRKAIFINSVFFVLGFGLVFALLGVTLNSLLKQIAYEVQLWLGRLGGAIIIFFGLYLMGLIKVPFLEREYRLKVTKKFQSKYLTSLVFGAAFAVGWSPCVGAVLGGILGLAATQPGIAFILLMAYSIGFGLPFLLVGAFTAPAIRLINRYQGWLKYVNFVFGVLLVGLGILIFTQSLSKLGSFELLNRFLLR